MKGSALASRLLWVRLGQGDAGMARLRAAVSPALATVVAEGAAMARWYPFEQFVELNEAIDRTFGAGDLGLVKELARFGADANLKTVYRLFYKVGTVRWILGRAARLWGAHYDEGELLVVEDRPREIVMEIAGWSRPHAVHCRSVEGWAERSIEISGGRDARVDSVACRARGDDRCLLRGAWR